VPLPYIFQNLEKGERRVLRNLSIAVASFLLICLITQIFTGAGKPEEIAEEIPLPASGLESQDNFVFRPRFETIDGEFSAGCAFVTLTPFSDKPIVLTALHLLGPAGGYYQQLESDTLRSTLAGLSLREIFTDELMTDFPVSALEIDDTAPLGQTVNSLAGDVAAFRIETRDGIPVEPAPLATGNTPLSVGSPLSLVYRVQGSEERLHKATIIEVKDKLFVYNFETKEELKLLGAAGAPLLNEAGEVAAIHLGGGHQNGRTFGLATPVSLFRSRLEVACRAPVQVSPKTQATASVSPQSTPNDGAP